MKITIKKAQLDKYQNEFIQHYINENPNSDLEELPIFQMVVRLEEYKTITKKSKINTETEYKRKDKKDELEPNT